MIDPFELYNSFKSYVNTFQGGFYRPQTDFLQAANNISNQLWEEQTREAEKSQEARDNLFYLTKTKNVLATPQKGKYSEMIPPKDYGRFASARILWVDNKTFPENGVSFEDCEDKNFKDQEQISEEYYDRIDERTARLIDQQRWAAALAHQKKGPTQEQPLINFTNQKFLIAPRTVTVVVLTYYIKPEPAVYAYTLSPGDEQTGAGDMIIYNKDQSRPLPWPTTMVNEFLIRLGERYGLFTRDQFVAQYSTNQKQTA